MFLERVEIVGFRGINRLSLSLKQNNVLIGENTWGKSSLLNALTLLLLPAPQLYQFTHNDFWYPPGQVEGRGRHLDIILAFREAQPGHHRARRFHALVPAWTNNEDGYARLFYHLEGLSDDAAAVITRRSFLDQNGDALALNNTDELAQQVTRLCPVLRLRDARFLQRIRRGTLPEVAVMTRELDSLARAGGLSPEADKRPDP